MSRVDDWMHQLRELIPYSASIAASYIRSFIPIMKEQYGVEPSAILLEAGINEEQLHSPGYRVSLYRTFRLLKLAEKHAADPFVGLRLGQFVDARSYEVLGYVLMSCHSLGEALQQLIRFDQLIWDVGGTSLYIEGDRAILELRPKNVPWVPAEAFEIAVSGQYAMGKWLTGLEDSPAEVHFKHEPRGDISVYQDVFNCEVKFKQPKTALIFDQSYMNAPIRYADPALKQMMEQTGQKILSQYRHESNIANEARAIIHELLPSAEHELETVAAKMGISPRNFSKRLANAGYQYKDLVEEVRWDLADFYLSSQTMSITDIAFLLGYSEQSAFSRAFKKWTGYSPKQYRY